MKKLLGCFLFFAGFALAQSGLTGGSDGLHQYNAKTLGQWGIFIGTGGNVATDSWGQTRGGYYYDNGQKKRLGKMKVSVSGNFHAGLGIADNVDIGANIPLYYDASEHSNNFTELSLGDLDLWMKASAPFLSEKSVLGLAGQMDIYFPTGEDEMGLRPRHAWYLKTSKSTQPFTAEEVVVSAMGILTLDLTKINVPIRFNANVGLAYANEGSNTFIYGTGLNIPVDSIEAFVEFSGEFRVEKNRYPRDFLTDPMILTPGMRFRLPLGFDIALGVDISMRALNNARYDSEKEMDGAHHYMIGYAKEGGEKLKYAYSPAPTYALTALLTWRFDRPKKAEKQKTDETPVQADFRKDTIVVVDTLHKVDTLYKVDSVVVFDSLKQDSTACLLKTDTLVKMDTIVKTDTLNIVDSSKINELLAQNAALQDSLATFSLDDDGDGVPNIRDLCPNTLNEVQVGRAGCPVNADENLEKLQHKILFKKGKATLDKKGMAALKSVAKLMLARKTLRIEFLVHTDEMKTSAKNKELSQKRGKEIVDYMISQGVPSKRIRFTAMGDTKPVVPLKKDKKGAIKSNKQNVRVEIMPRGE